MFDKDKNRSKIGSVISAKLSALVQILPCFNVFIDELVLTQHSCLNSWYMQIVDGTFWKN